MQQVMLNTNILQLFESLISLRETVVLDTYFSTNRNISYFDQLIMQLQ